MDDLNSNGGGGASENDEGLGVTRRKRAGSRKELGAAAVIGRGKPLIVGMCGTLVYYHCAYRDSSIISLISDVFIVLLCSLAILGLLFRQMNIQYVFHFLFLLILVINQIQYSNNSIPPIFMQ